LSLPPLSPAVKNTRRAPASQAQATEHQPEGEHATEGEHHDASIGGMIKGMMWPSPTSSSSSASSITSQQAAQGIPRDAQLDDPQGPRRSRGAEGDRHRAARRHRTEAAGAARRTDTLRTRGAEDIKAEEQRIAAAAAADRERLLEQTRREIELQVRLAKKEILEHAADLSVQLATERIKKEVTPEDQDRLVDRYLDRKVKESKVICR
jgi:hypothetical protein